jgi:intracellular sulfur oxidation DsrE/DsrF family protein
MRKTIISAAVLVILAAAGGFAYAVTSDTHVPLRSDELPPIPATAYAPQKVVYHVSTRGSWRDRESEARRLVAVLNNHVRALEPDPAEIQVILQGDGIDVLRRARENQKLARSIDALRAKGVVFRVCANTLEAYHVGLETLHGVHENDLVQAGVAELIHLQRQGYGYIKF